MTLPVKILLGIGGSGATAASGYGIYEFIRPKTIGEKLLWEGKEFLSAESDNNGDDSVWNDLYTKYSASENASDKFTGDDSSSITDKTKLRDYCKRVLEKPLSEEGVETVLPKARFWCVKNSEKLTSSQG